MAGEGWQMDFESIDQLGWSSEVERYQKLSISFLWLERGGRWGSSSSISQADHQKLNVIQKWAFHFFWLERSGGWGSSPLTSLANHQKLNIIKIWAFHFLAGDRWWMGFKSINKPGWSSEVERHVKMSISFYWLERGGRWGLSSSISLTNHQKMNITQKWAFPILAGEGWQMGFESIDQPGWSSEVNVIQKEAFHFIGWRGLADGD